MKLYEINESIEMLREFKVDPETGEILDNTSAEDIAEMIGVLELDRAEKLEACACVYKEMKNEAKELTDAKKEVTDRYQAEINARERRAESIRAYMEQNMKEGEKLKTMQASIYWQKNPSSVEVDFKYLPTKYLKIQKPQADKTTLMEKLTKGEKIEGAWLVEGRNGIRIK